MQVTFGDEVAGKGARDSFILVIYIKISVQILGALDLLDIGALRQFVLSTQDPITGGLAKYPNAHPDGLHTYLGISGLSLLRKDNLKPVDPALNISQQALSHLHQLHKNISKLQFKKIS